MAAPVTFSLFVYPNFHVCYNNFATFSALHAHFVIHQNVLPIFGQSGFLMT